MQACIPDTFLLLQLNLVGTLLNQQGQQDQQIQQGLLGGQQQQDQQIQNQVNQDQQNQQNLLNKDQQQGRHLLSIRKRNLMSFLPDLNNDLNNKVMRQQQTHTRGTYTSRSACRIRAA